MIRFEILIKRGQRVDTKKIEVKENDMVSANNAIASALIQGRCLYERDARAIATSLQAYTLPANCTRSYRVICKFTGLGGCVVNIRVKRVHTESNWADIRSDYSDDKYIYIDAWKTTLAEEEGTVVAKIKLSDGSVIYNDNKAKTDPYVKEVIDAELKKLKEQKAHSGKVKGANYKVKGNVGTLETTNKPFRDCSIEACPYNANYKCYSKNCINKESFVYRVFTRDNNAVNVNAKSYIDAARKVAKQLLKLDVELETDTTGDWILLVRKYKSTELEIPVGEKYFRVKR